MLAKFHPVFGPMMMVAYACLSNTLLLTSMLIFFSDGTTLTGSSLQFWCLCVS